MNYPISPEFVNVIHQQKIRELERDVELARMLKVQRAAGALERQPAWYAQAAQWMKAKLFKRVSERQPARI